MLSVFSITTENFLYGPLLNNILAHIFLLHIIMCKVHTFRESRHSQCERESARDWQNKQIILFELGQLMRLKSSKEERRRNESKVRNVYKIWLKKSHRREWVDVFQ